MRLFDGTLRTLEHALDVRLAKHGALAQNVANVDTRDYTPRDVDFAASMEQQLAADRVREAGFASSAPSASGLARPAIETKEDRAAAPGLDGNRVDLERTLTDLATNALAYDGVAKAAGRKLATLRYVASDGNA